MIDKTFHYKYVKTPRFYFESFIKVVVALFLVMLACIYLSPKASISTTTLITLFSAIVVGIGIYIFTRKYVNYVVLNYNNKTIEIFYIEPFRESSKKGQFTNFDFSYYTKSYDLFNIRTWKVLRMNIDNSEFRVSQLELTFPLETMEEMADTFGKLKSS